MSTYFKTLDTSEGQIHVLTKTRWMGFVPMPRTSVMPHNATDLKGLGTLIKWTTNDPAMLCSLHDAIVHLVEEIGISGLFEIANCVKMTEQAVGRLGIDWRGAIKEAIQKGIIPPVSDDVLRHIKGFT